MTEKKKEKSKNRNEARWQRSAVKLLFKMQSNLKVQEKPAKKKKELEFWQELYPTNINSET